jgi:hypothetical protein
VELRSHFRVRDQIKGKKEDHIGPQLEIKGLRMIAPTLYKSSH